MGEGFETTAALLLPILLGDLAVTATAAGGHVLMGMGKLRRITYTNAFFAVTNVVAVVLLTGVWNHDVEVVGWTYCAVHLLRAGVVLPIVMALQLGISPLRLYRRTYLGPLLAGAAAAGWALLVRDLVPVEGWLSLGMAGALFAIGFAPLAYGVGFDGYDRQVFHQLTSDALGRLRRTGGRPDR